MRLNGYTTKQIVEYCLKQRKEGDFWDFKQEWHEDNEELLKDIICFANTVHNEKCYIIFGISDDFKVVGMSLERRKQADIIDMLSRAVFAGGVCPRISVETIQFRGVELDVLAIENVNMTPVYLDRQYGKKLFPGRIYARVKDRNTAFDSNADIQTVEMLWKKRFGLTKSPYDYIMDSLQNIQDWAEGKDEFYNIYKPEYRIHKHDIDLDSARDDPFYAYTQIDHKVYYSTLDILVNNTIVDSYPIVYLDGARLEIPVPDYEFLHISIAERWEYRFFVRGDKKFKLLQFMLDPENLEAKYDFNDLMDVVLMFESLEEKEEFKKFVLSNLNELNRYMSNNPKYNYLGVGKDKKEKLIQEDLKRGAALNKMLLIWRNRRKS